jgi:hypothetical protein
MNRHMDDKNSFNSTEPVLTYNVFAVYLSLLYRFIYTEKLGNFYGKITHIK